MPWNPVSTPAMLGLSSGFGLMVYLLTTGDMLGERSVVLFLVHNVNLVFHEAGHWIFGIFGNETLTVFGGSLNQVLVPLAAALSFWWRRDAAGFAFGAFWTFENFLDVAVYMADARALVMPLIGGLGDDAHDWRNLFFRFNLIDRDTVIAGRTRVAGWAGMLGVWAWFVMRWSAGRV
ncbi:MAG: hypothetical protein HY579_05440 [Nitrospinae bacterium]|nr:hypothetical protein [Nitrospinota bacterium]